MADSSSTEEIIYNLIVNNAKIQDLMDTLNTVKTLDGQVAVLNELLTELYKNEQLSGVSAKDLAAAFRNVQEAMGSANVMNQDLVENIAKEVAATEKATDATKKKTAAEKDNAAQLEKMNSVQKEIVSGLVSMGMAESDAISMTVGLGNALQTAFGLNIYSLVINLVNATKQFFSDLLAQAQELQAAFGKLMSAEMLLSNEGVKVSGKDLLDLVKQLHDEFHNISQIDLLKETANTAFRMENIGLSVKELKGLVEAANTSAIAIPGLSADEAGQMISRYALTGNTRSIASLGFTGTAEEVQNYAKQSGIIGDINQKLTEQQAIHARLGYIIEQNQGRLGTILPMQDNLANSSDRLAAKWEDFKTALTPIVTVWNVLVYLLSLILEGWTTIVGLLDGAVKAVTPLQKATVSIWNAIWDWIPPLRLAKEELNAIIALYEKISGRKLSDQSSSANLSKQDTPTNLNPDSILSDSTTKETEQKAKRIESTLHSLFEAMNNFGERARELDQKFADSQADALDKYNTDLRRLNEDLNHSILLEQQKSQQDIAKKQAEYNQKKLDDEAKFQLEMKYMQEKYEFDLVDALQNRDARRVLQLARQYALEKQHAIDVHALQTAQDDERHNAEMQQAQREAADRIAQLEYEAKLKAQRLLEDYNAKKAIDARNHKEEMDRLEQEKNDRLRSIANSLAEQLDLTEAGANAIYNTLLGYFGPNGNVNELMKFTYENSSAYMGALMASLVEFSKEYAAATGDHSKSLPTPSRSGGSSSTTPSTPNRPNQLIPRMANGGALIASDPTLVQFAEAGSEAAMFIPLDQLGPNGSGGGGLFGGMGGGKVQIELTLDPDLEARIVESSLEQVTSAIVSVRKGR